MDSENYRKLLVRERFKKDLNQEDYENTLQYYAELYHNEMINKIKTKKEKKRNI